MGTREVSPRQWHGDPARAFHLLRSRWRTASLASGWPFPNDWSVAEVDVVCRAALAGQRSVAGELGAELVAALETLGRARAEAGFGLGETLQDVAALHAVLTVPDNGDGMVSADPDAIPARLLRVTAMAWADVLVRQVAHTEVSDALTGLANAAYLRARLREVYREAAAAGVEARSKYVLVVVAPQLDRTVGWSRMAAMVLLAEVLRAVFDGGQTLAAVGPATVAVLAERDDRLGERISTARWLAADRLALDPQLREIGVPPVWLERLPGTHEAACRLLTELASV